MRAWVIGVFLMTGATIQAFACETAECALSTYLDAHITRDAATVYELTAKSERPDKPDFLSSYHDSWWTYDKMQNFLEQHTGFQLELISESDGFSRVRAETHYPDYRTPALERARQGHGLESREEWEALVDHLNRNGFEIISDQAEFYLIKEGDGKWRVLRPLIH